MAETQCLFKLQLRTDGSGFVGQSRTPGPAHQGERIGALSIEGVPCPMARDRMWDVQPTSGEEVSK